jgi:1-acyl-sn-glycerol-3-phosphate acyltransferase
MSVAGRIKQGGKILASGCLFSILGLGGLLVSTLIVPLVKLTCRDALKRQQRGRRLIHLFFKAFVWAMEATGILSLEVEGLLEARELAGKLILANHPGYLDVVLIISVLGESACVVKKGVYNNPFFGGLVRMAGHVPNLDPEDVLARGAEVLAKGNSLIVFPEGTRSHQGKPLHFQRGAAHLALGSRAPIVPLIVTCDPPLLEKGAKWYDIPVRTCRYRIHAQAPLAFDLPGIERLTQCQAARVLTRELEGHFNKEVNESNDHAH